MNHHDHNATETGDMEHPPMGVSMSSRGYTLSPVSAPADLHSEGQLEFMILDGSGEPVRRYTKAHEQDLHLIVVRSDGAHFRHVHPVLDASTGVWSLPWAWTAAGSYRLYADFTPAASEAAQIVLSRTVDVAGSYEPERRTTAQTGDAVGGFDVTIDGTLTVGHAQPLTVSVHRDGVPVSTVQPYLGAFGHLVALREGDLAYLHVHPSGTAPEPGDTGGPTITFGAQAPTEGRYYLYLDFQVDNAVHTAEFVLEAVREGSTAPESNAIRHEHPKPTR